MSPPFDNSIEAHGLVREFKKGPRAVDGIDLRVDPGEIYGFLGPNGAGKSTTVHMLTTLLPPTAGTARVAGFDVIKEGPQVRKAIGAALQEAALDPFLTGREHLKLQTAMHGITGDERKQRSDELLARVGLTEAADRNVKGYSGGMKRRLDLALALVHHPRVLFLDEPTTGLDIQSRTALWEEVERLAKQDGVTVFLTTQYLEEADVLADRVGIIDHGTSSPRERPSSSRRRSPVPPSRPFPRSRTNVTLSPTCSAGSASRSPGSAATASRCSSRRRTATSRRSCARSTPKASTSRICRSTSRRSTTSSSRRRVAISRVPAKLGEEAAETPEPARA